MGTTMKFNFYTQARLTTPTEWSSHERHFTHKGVTNFNSGHPFEYLMFLQSFAEALGSLGGGLVELEPHILGVVYTTNEIIALVELS